MHVAFVSSLVPVAEPRSGFDIANRVVVDALRSRGVRVTALGFALPDVDIAHPDETLLLGRQEVTTAKAAMKDKLRWLARAFGHGTSFASAKMLEVTSRDIADKLQAVGPLDGVILNSVQLPGAFADTLARWPSIYLAHNVEFRSALENAQSSPSRFEQFLFRREARFLERMERTLTTRARFVWTLSEEDRIALVTDRRAASAVLPLVTTIEPPVKTKPVEADYDLALIGTWTWQPNRVGLDWFLQEIVPHLAADVTIRIAGAIAGRPRVPHPGVRFVGRVDDATRFVRGARVIPLASRGGTGVQLKTIETFELGLPSVATASALRGIEHVPGNCSVAEDPRDFAAALMARITASRRGDSGVIDGGAFHAGQVAGLGAALDAGLAALKP